MSYYNSYNYYRPSLFGGFRFFPPVIKALLISNAGIFLLTFFFGLFRIGDYPLTHFITVIFALFPLNSDYFGIWQIFTYMFMHAGFMHLFFNMFALWMFGMELENNWGSRKFLTYYLLCGIGAGLSNLFIGPLFGQAGPTVGASGAVYGILLAFGVMFPNRPIFLYFFIPIKAKYFVLIFMGLELYAGIAGTPDNIAHFAHLGGAAVGLFLLLVDMKKIPLYSWWENIKSLYVKPSRYDYSQKDKIRNINDAKYFDMHEGEDIEEYQRKVDEILDKVSREGYQNLTEEEKKILFEASKKLH